MCMYQGNNQSNVHIYPRERGLPTTQKVVSNSILKNIIENDSNGCRYISLDYKYASPQLLEIVNS